MKNLHWVKYIFFWEAKKEGIPNNIYSIQKTYRSDHLNKNSMQQINGIAAELINCHHSYLEFQLLARILIVFLQWNIIVQFHGFILIEVHGLCGSEKNLEKPRMDWKKFPATPGKSRKMAGKLRHFIFSCLKFAKNRQVKRQKIWIFETTEPKLYANYC